MAEASYLLGRKKYSRPQAMLFSDQPPQRNIINGGTANQDFIFVPPGVEEFGADYLPSSTDNFVIVSDHNRSAIDITKDRIEKRERMINGNMRSYHIADKLSLSTSWSNLPSRSFSSNPLFDTTSGAPTTSVSDGRYTVDGGAGGAELLEWYENHQGSFWLYLAYDKPSEFENESNPYANLSKYTEFVEVFFSDFQYSVSQRGASTHDFWNVSLALEEV